MSIYPDNWPSCPRCGEAALDGHITCGKAECNESGARRMKAEMDRDLDRALQVGRMFGNLLDNITRSR